MVVQFIEDGSRYWFPLPEIERFLKDMQSKGRNAESDTIGQGSHAFAAQVLAGTLVAKKKASGLTSSSATAGACLPSEYCTSVCAAVVLCVMAVGYLLCGSASLHTLSKQCVYTSLAPATLAIDSADLAPNVIRPGQHS